MPKLDLHPPELLLVKSLLKQFVPDADVWAYGSRVNGTCHESSDLDLVIRDPHALGQATEHLAQLKQAFIDSDLPIIVDIMDWASLPKEYQNEIKKNYVVIQSIE